MSIESILSHDNDSLGMRSAGTLFRWHGYAALIAVLYVVLMGLLMAVKLHAPEFLGTAFLLAVLGLLVNQLLGS